jgi:hypothetical protein
MNRLELDIQHWPIVVTVVRNGASEEEYERYFIEFGRKVLDREQHFTSLCDSSSLSEPPGAAQRRKIAEWEIRESERGVRLNLGIAMVFTSRIARGALTALHWLVPPRTPTVVLATREEGFEWCLGKLDAARIAVPQSVRSLALRQTSGSPPMDI